MLYRNRNKFINQIRAPLFFSSQSQSLVARTYHPPFSNFLFTNLFSIKFLYFFIISSLFPYFNLFVSIFIQSYVNIKLHVSTLLGMQLGRFKIVPLLASSTFIAPYFHYVIETRTFLKDASFCPCFCFVHTIAQFSRILRFSHIYCQIFRIRTHGTTALTSTIGSETFQTFK